MNPELQRNLWLQAQPRQLAMSGGVLVAIFAVVWLVDRGRSPFSFVGSGVLLFVGSALIWAPRAARASVTDEVFARTWDMQRSSALSSWTLTWGKLSGATCRTWLFAAVGLVVALLQLASISSFGRAIFWLLIGLGLAILMQASGLAVGLIDIRKARALGRAPGHRSPGLWLLALGLLAAGCLVWAQGRAVWKVDIGAGVLASAQRPVTWWGYAHDPAAFAAASLVLFAVWGIVWAWRMMRLELQLQNLPWAWLLFVAFAGFYASGFQLGPPDADGLGQGLGGRALMQATLTWTACAFAGAFIDPADRVQARQSIAALWRGDLGLVCRNSPLMLAPTLLATAALGAQAMRDWRIGEPNSALYTVGFLAFILRDLGLITALRFAPRGRRGDFGVLLTVVLIYAAGGLFARSLAGARGAALLLVSSDHPALSLWAGLSEALVVWAFAAWRIGRPAPKPRQVRPHPSATNLEIENEAAAKRPDLPPVRPWRTDAE